MLIYPHYIKTYERWSIFDDNPIFIGTILSASGNHTLERRISDFVNNDLRNVVGKRANPVSVLKTFAELELNNLVNNALINLYVEKIV